MCCVCGTVMFALMQNDNYELFDVMICGKQMMMNQRVKQPNLTMHLYYINLRLWGTPSRLRNVHVRTCFKCGRKRILVHPLPLCTLFCEPHVVCAIPFLSNTFLRQWDVSEFPDDQTRQRKMQSASLANCMDLNSNLLIWGMSEVSK